jgi:tRNA(Phe) wybutosine-synthesizing methylase Tyw3
VVPSPSSLSYIDHATVRRRDPIHHRKTKSRAPGVLLRGEKGLGRCAHADGFRHTGIPASETRIIADIVQVPGIGHGVRAELVAAPPFP